MYSNYVARLQKVKLFNGMQQDEIVKILGCLNAYIKEYTKGNYIYMQGDSFEDIGIILEGRVTVVQEHQNGYIVTINILDKNDTFGEDIVCLNNRYSQYSLIASSKTKILYIKGSRLLEDESTQCKYRSRVNLNMLKCMAEYSVRISKRMKYMSILTLKKRIITLLLDYQEELGKDKFSIGMNREEMAYYLNTTRVSISRILIDLKKEGLIEYHKDLFTIKDKQGLINELD